MKEDILEQLVDEYLQHQGYFTRHNIKFRPDNTRPDFNSKQDSVHSDIDVVGINPVIQGHHRVVAVSCKSWQSGFNSKSKIAEIENNKIISGREAWRGFRELTRTKWAEAFIDKVEEISGSRKFTYITAVTFHRGDRSVWEGYADFSKILHGNPIRILTLADILKKLWPTINTTPASSGIGRTLQLIKAARWLETRDQNTQR